MSKQDINRDKAKNIKGIITGAACTVAAVILIIFYFAYPQINAANRIEKIYGIIESGDYDYVVLSQIRPFTSGTIEQMTTDFELKLEGEEKEAFIGAFLSSCKSIKENGSSIEKAGFWDMKVTVFSGDERFVIYVYDGGVYVTEKYRRYNFSTADNGLFEAVTAIKEAQYK